MTSTLWAATQQRYTMSYKPTTTDYRSNHDLPEFKSVRKMKISDVGLALTTSCEGLELTAYPDPGTGKEPYTIGYGTTVYPDGTKVKLGDTCSKAQAVEYLRNDMSRAEA